MGERNRAILYARCDIHNPTNWERRFSANLRRILAKRLRRYGNYKPTKENPRRFVEFFARIRVQKCRGRRGLAALPRTPRRFGRGSSRKQYEFSRRTSWGCIEKPPVSTPGASHSFGCSPYDASRRRSSGTFERKFRDSVSCSPPLVTSVKSPVRRECSSRITSRFTIIDR
jgi:hypothetical protein